MLLAGNLGISMVEALILALILLTLLNFAVGCISKQKPKPKQGTEEKNHRRAA